MRPLPLLLACALLAHGCQESADELPADPPVPEAVTPATLTPDDLQHLRWIEGAWSGAGYDEPFFEGYRFLNDSTIQTFAYTDSTATAVADSGLIVLAGGVLSTGSGGARWVATELDSAHVHFAPEAGARNAFTWRYESPSAWTATLVWPSEGGGEARERVYRMERIGAAPPAE